MNEPPKPADTLTLQDVKRARVWEYAPEDEVPDETYVFPVSQLPVKHLDNRLVSAELRLANGARVWGLLASVDLENDKLSELFIDTSVFRSDGVVFFLARYFDSDFDTHGPDALAAGLSREEVFPIAYDISDVVSGSSGALRGLIRSEPKRRFTSHERMMLSIERPKDFGADDELPG